MYQLGISLDLQMEQIRLTKEGHFDLRDSFEKHHLEIERIFSLYDFHMSRLVLVRNREKRPQTFFFLHW